MKLGATPTETLSSGTFPSCQSLPSQDYTLKMSGEVLRKKKKKKRERKKEKKRRKEEKKERKKACL